MIVASIVISVLAMVCSGVQFHYARKLGQINRERAWLQADTARLRAERLSRAAR